VPREDKFEEIRADVSRSLHLEFA